MTLTSGTQISSCIYLVNYIKQLYAVENTQHFYFHCRYYQAYESNFSTPNPFDRSLLYGGVSLPQKINTNILAHVQMLILDTKRL